VAKQKKKRKPSLTTKNTQFYRKSLPDKGYYYPMFPIIMSKDNGIVDGLQRYAVCQQNNLPLEKIVIPFTEDQINTPECIALIIKIQKDQDEKLEAAFLKYNIDFQTQIIQCSSQMRLRKFYQFKDEFTEDTEYWSELRDAYVMSSNTRNFQKEIRELFTANRTHSICIMAEKEIALLENLASKITIYRGMTEEENISGEYGISWTLDKKVAEKFATSYAHNYDTVGLPKIVKELTIDKKNIIAYFIDRKEDEIIYIHPSCTKLT